MGAPKVKLTYFNLRGRAEPTRMLLAYGGIEFEDCRVANEGWMSLKPKTPYGSLPVMEWNGEGLAQLEKRLVSRGGQYFVGNAFSWADLQLYNLTSGFPDQSMLNKFPKIKNLMARVADIPNIKRWVEKRPVTSM